MPETGDAFLYIVFPSAFLSEICNSVIQFDPQAELSSANEV
jgi:hypothetical protein